MGHFSNYHHHLDYNVYTEMIYWQLFYTFFRVGLFAFGGGYAILSLIEHDVIDNGWATESEFIDMVAISQITPGPVGINIATYVGYTTTNSVVGSAITTFAITLPSLIIMLIVCLLYEYLNEHYSKSPYFQNVLKVLRWLVVGLIATAVITLLTDEVFFDISSYIICAITFCCFLIPKFISVPKKLSFVSNPITLILIGGLIGWMLYY